MIPSIESVICIEMITDGGSLAATFQAPGGQRYWLFLKIRMRDLPSGDIERLGYADPVIIARPAGDCIPISWQQAQSMITQIRSLVSDKLYLEWLSLMECVITSYGEFPPRLDRILRPINLS
jgi:hypothetical protein